MEKHLQIDAGKICLVMRDDMQNRTDNKQYRYRGQNYL